jgi:hypothetical protein
MVKMEVSLGLLVAESGEKPTPAGGPQGYVPGVTLNPYTTENIHEKGQNNLS